MTWIHWFALVSLTCSSGMLAWALYRSEVRDREDRARARRLARVTLAREDTPEPVTGFGGKDWRLGRTR